MAVNNEIVITLRIDNIVEEDDAVYLCQVKVGINDMITKRVKLNVKTPVKILDSSTTELIRTKIPNHEAAFGGSLQQHSSILTTLSSLATVFSISVFVI